MVGQIRATLGLGGKGIPGGFKAFSAVDIVSGEFRQGGLFHVLLFRQASQAEQLFHVIQRQIHNLDTLAYQRTAAVAGVIEKLKSSVRMRVVHGFHYTKNRTLSLETQSPLAYNTGDSHCAIFTLYLFLRCIH